MKINKTKRFEFGQFNYRIKYWQFQTNIKQEDGSSKKELYHCEEVKYYKFPFTFLTKVQCGPCEDTGDYYRQ